MGPMRTRDLVVLLIGLRIVEVASLYRFIGEKDEVIFSTSSCFITASGSKPAFC